MKTIKLSAAALAIGATAAVAGHAATYNLAERQLAMAEERLIINTPIAGIKNDLWFDYRNDIGEAKEELQTDLNDVTDIEDERDAYEEYATELRHERKVYVAKMAKKGYRTGSVKVG